MGYDSWIYCLLNGMKDDLMLKFFLVFYFMRRKEMPGEMRMRMDGDFMETVCLDFILITY